MIIDWDEVTVQVLSACMTLTEEDAGLIREHHLFFREISPLGDYVRWHTRLLGYYGEVSTVGDRGAIHGPWRPTARWALKSAFARWKSIMGR